MVSSLQVAHDIAYLCGHGYEEDYVDVSLKSIYHQQDIDQNNDDHYTDDDLGLLVHVWKRRDLEGGKLKDEAHDDEQEPGTEDLHSFFLYGVYSLACALCSF